MYSLSPNITLSIKHRRLYHLCQILLIALGITGLYLLLASIVLPKVTLSHNVRNTDPAFDLSAPQNTSSATTFSGSLLEDVDHVEIEIEMAEDATPTSSTLTVKKGHRAFLISKQANQDHAENTQQIDLPYVPGSLIRSSSQYFVVQGNTLRPITTSDVLTASGYAFTTAIYSSSEDRAVYDKGERFDMRSDHPSGTHFLDTRTSQHFLLVGNTLHKTQAPSGNKTPVILVDSASLVKKDICNLRKSLFTNTYSCKMSLQNTHKLPGKDFIFELPGINQDVRSIQAKFTVAPTTKNIRSRLGLIKEKLSQ